MNDLVRGLQAGRPEAFERLVGEFGDRLYRFARRMVGERAAEDLTQEVLLRVMRSVGDYSPTGRFESWLFTIASRLAIDEARRRKAENLRSEADPEGGLGRTLSKTPEPPQQAEDEERRRAILEAVERLPLDQKQVFLLREEGGLSFREIAEIVGCPLNTALGRMHYAMESLRRHMKAYGVS
jgi:RNA polymerase sigma-70 factor (ECF subfamily)